MIARCQQGPEVALQAGGKVRLTTQHGNEQLHALAGVVGRIGARRAQVTDKFDKKGAVVAAGLRSDLFKQGVQGNHCGAFVLRQLAV
ncbi:hypothetical protein GCM10025770_36680 [Viridibacterium curvum]|uniref:Uncharacterized protein n=1 Tax=Viridibacterium curvum TaxID=1101404 RepID=A0ABP9R541_9RHOO